MNTKPITFVSCNFMGKKILSCLLLSLILSNIANGTTLKNILKHSLTSAPEIKEASANIDASHNRTEQAKSQHWPVVSLTGSQSLLQHHRNRADYTNKSFQPGIEGQINLYAFGAMEADVDRTKKEEEFYQYQYATTQEDLGYEIAKLYLEALNMKEAITVSQKSLKRHQEILKNIDVILANDEGRESEYVQAEARLIMVQQDINNYRKRLANALTTLSKYTGIKVSESDLNNPFSNLSDNQLFSQYSAKDKLSTPMYKAQQADLDAKKLAMDAEDKKQLPRINLVASATREDRQVGLKVSWDILNRANSYSVREKISDVSASRERLARISRDIDDRANLAKINITESRTQLNTLKSQINASAKVVDFYKLQFEIARRSLLDVLNAERELSSVELAYATTQHSLRSAILDYLYSQGSISNWSGVTSNLLNNTNK
ncbi:TolC family protein [Otariodibacter sp.]|uniref:TolC family protein n=1 Tax=Otariodibacter sp. TaxID=3030919 RepID=UPI00260EA01E|nr:TolC family protein [Otariodibacter sp.]